MLVQACESMVDPQTRKREISALSDAMTDLGIETATIVTRNEEEIIKTESGLIEIVPAWQFLLNLPD